MAIKVLSPHSGRLVMVREQDVGRAVRDEGGRIFYVLVRSDGAGHYGSPTRSGGAAYEKRALELAAQPAAAEPPEPAAVASQGAEAPTGPGPVGHDATGRRRAVSGRWIILVLAVVMALIAFLFSPWGPYGAERMPRVETPEPNPIGIGPEGN